MKKRLKSKTKIKKSCFENLFSKARIESYENIWQYLSNLALVERITPIIGGLEVCIRNKIHLAMSQKIDSYWIFDLIKQKDSYVDFRSLLQAFERSDRKNFYTLRDQIKKSSSYNRDYKDILRLIKTHFDNLSHKHSEFEKTTPIKDSVVNILISRQSCGFWGEVLSKNLDIHFLNHPCHLDFELYNGGVAKNAFLTQAYNDQEIKDRVAFFLLKNLRNRAFHWENLLKTQSKNSRITASIKYNNRDVYFEIKPKLIERFLEDMLRAVDIDLAEVLRFYRKFKK